MYEELEYGSKIERNSWKYTFISWDPIRGILAMIDDGGKFVIHRQSAFDKPLDEMWRHVLSFPVGPLAKAKKDGPEHTIGGWYIDEWAYEALLDGYLKRNKDV